MAHKRRAASRMGMVVTTVALTAAVHRRLALIGLEEGSALAELIRQAVNEWLVRRDRRQGRGVPR